MLTCIRMSNMCSLREYIASKGNKYLNILQIQTHELSEDRKTSEKLINKQKRPLAKIYHTDKNPNGLLDIQFVSIFDLFCDNNRVFLLFLSLFLIIFVD